MLKSNFNSLTEFAEYVSNNLDTSDNVREFTFLDKIPLTDHQCIYLVDWTTDKIVYCRGQDKLLGYSREEFNSHLILEYFHPQEREYVQRVIKGVVKHCIKTDIENGRPHLSLLCRIRKKNGSFISTLRQSTIFQADEKGALRINYSMLTNVDFLKPANSVLFDIHIPNLDIDEYKKFIFREFQDYFTQREKKVVKLIEEGKTSMEIASELFISVHTVSTHRKNILRKAQSTNRRELLSFCRKHGIL